MRTRDRLSAGVVAASLWLAAVVPTVAPAHEDERLAEALAGAPEDRARYEVALLSAQLSGAFGELGEPAIADRLLDMAREARRAIEHPYIRQAVAGDTANEVSGADFDEALRLLGRIEDTELWVKTAWKLSRKAGRDDSDPAPMRALLSECIRRARGADDLALRAELISGTGTMYRYDDPAIGAPLVYESYGLAQAIDDPYERAIMFNEVGAHLMDIGDADRAAEVFDEVGRLVGEIEGPLERARALVMLGGEQAEKGLRDRAADALERGVAEAERLPEGEQRADVMSELARNFGQSYRFERGIEVARGIDDPYHRAEGFIRIAKNQRRQDREAEADGLLGEVEALVGPIDDPYRRGVVLRKLASEYRDAGRPDEVRRHLDAAAEALDELVGGGAAPGGR